MKPKDLARLVKVYERWAKSICAPIIFPDKEGHMHNGSMTFIRTDSEVLGITNSHVADSITHCGDELGKRCQVGAAHFDPNWLIARHPVLDLATFHLSDVFLSQVDFANPVAAATVTTWPPKPPSEDDPVLYGGYPGSYREQNNGSITVGFAWFAGKVQSVSQNNIGMVLDIANSVATSPERIRPDADLGGWSGGSVFRVVEENLLERLELTAIIYEYSNIYEIALAHPLTDLLPDGTFDHA